ncbi:helix-turn-helix transcriptional regulator [Streptomyces flavotricini]|uniref:Helix-turn-helix transcriptional regulator n=1 Tax=Streptomyces flavotricini TaxID=66888 RepID=A0ABS8EGV3_9ACTN|nr:helix-turn-helix transcriptional regulator [Streptomyces flavotricini]MCC0100174.1 helix-turn-helix transcriptional regulator [Streptomyces flavotricini]
MTDTSPALTGRERQVLCMLSSGDTVSSIARQLGLSPHTVDTYLRRLRTKTGTANRTQLTVFAVRNGYVGRPPHGAAEDDRTVEQGHEVGSRPI